MLKIIRTNSKNSDFLELVKKLDVNLAITDGDDHAFYSQFNKLDNIKNVVLAYKDQKAIACGAIKKANSESTEIKRMYVLEEHRGSGVAILIMAELENWAKELNFKKLVLETGINQKAAIAFYKKTGFVAIENYGQYQGIKESFCFGKTLANN